MFNASNAPSLADIAAVTNNNDNNGFGNGWWVLIILFALFGGWGRGGYGYGSGGGENSYAYVSGGNCHCATPADIQRGFDTQSVTNKLNGLENGLASLGYDQLSQMNGINANIAAGFAGVNNAVCTLGYQNAQLINGVGTNIMQATNTLQNGQTNLGFQLQQCCCDNRSAIADLKYALADMTSQIMQNCNANYRSLHDENVAAQMAAKDAQIAEQAMMINNLNLRASQEAQTCSIQNAITAAVDRCNPRAVPSYPVPNPNAVYNYGCCGGNGGCCN